MDQLEQKLINFCDDQLKTEITCDKPSSDGFEVTNLLTPEKCGFLAFSCLRPPVTISVKFPCRIQLSHVTIGANVGAQRSTGFRVSAAGFGPNFRDISTGFITGSESGILFCQIPHSSLAKSSKMAVVHFNNLDLSNINCLRISIIKTQNSVPGIRDLKIWGSISKRNDQESLVSMHNLLKMKAQKSPKEEVTKKTETIEDSRDSEYLEIPEEFLDPITWNIMTQPIVLPSGKVIDQSTLESFGKSEANWGRALSDPFTSIPFNQNCRPVFASALKAQIDRFLTDNSNHPDVNRLPRVLGSGANLMVRNRPVDLGVLDGPVASGSNHRTNQQQRIRGDLVGARHLMPRVIKRKSDHLEMRMPLKKEDSVVMASASVVKVDESGIDDELKVSLNSVLSGLKRFDSKAEDRVDADEKCGCCDVKNWYRLSCGHKICRKGLVGRDNCPECGQGFRNSDVVKLNF